MTTKLVGAAVIITLVGVAAVVGPRVYRAGRALVAPVVEMSRLEDQLVALNSEFPPSPLPANGLDADRMAQFLAIRRELLPAYRRWDRVVREVEARGDSWAGAREVLAETRDVLQTQISALRSRSMSPAEFRDIERLVYDEWLDRLDAAAGRVGDTDLIAMTQSDLGFVREQIQQHGSTPGLERMERRFASRLETLRSDGPPAVDGVSPAAASLLWSLRDEIEALRLQSHAMHSALQTSRSGGLQIHVGSPNGAHPATPAPEMPPRDR